MAKKEKVRVWISRDGTGISYYCLSKTKPKKADGGCFRSKKYTLICPRDFHEWCDLELKPGQDPVQVKFPKTKMKVIKRVVKK